MAIPPHEFRDAKGQFFDLEALQTDQDNWITAVAVTIQGIVGSANTGAGLRPQQYRLFIDVSRLRTTLPEVWVASPSDREIKHVNIFRAHSACPFTGISMPNLCWGITPGAWRNLPMSERSLPNLLEAIRDVLGKANLNSRAR